MRPVVWISDPALRDRVSSLGSEAVHVSSLHEFLNCKGDVATLYFVDETTLKELSIPETPIPGPVVVVCDDTLATAIGWLQPYPWLAHVISKGMLEHPMAAEHLKNLLATLVASRPRLLDWLPETMAGRRVKLTQSNRRAERLERMGAFFESKGVTPRTVQVLRDAAEELLTNAFYNAPVTAGALARPVSRTQEIELPDEHGCDLAYGCRDDLAIVRVRDPFGSFTRRRLVEILSRCAKMDMSVQVDETMGGAGLGMWRIFSGATFVAISVIQHRKTEVLVGVAKRATRGPRPFAFHLFFTSDPSERRRHWEEDSRSRPSSQSVMLILKPE